MTEQSDPATPVPFLELLNFSGLSPEVFRALNDDQRAEYERAFIAQRNQESF